MNLKLCWLDYKRYYYKSYCKNNKIPEIVFFFYNCGGKNNNNVMILYLNMNKYGTFFGGATFHLYIKVHTKNDCYCAFNRLKLL